MVNPNQIPQPDYLLGHYAGIMSRLLAFIIDVLILALSILSTTWFVSVTIDLMQVKPVLEFLISTFSWFEAFSVFVLNAFTASLVGFVVVVTYHVFFWFFTGQTIGKAVVGLKVVPLHGKMTIWKAMFRYAAYFVAGLPFGLGFLWIIVDDRRMGWHDKLARTCVIYTWAAKPDEVFLKNAQESLATQDRDIHGLSVQRDHLDRSSKRPRYD